MHRWMGSYICGVVDGRGGRLDGVADGNRGVWFAEEGDESKGRVMMEWGRGAERMERVKVDVRESRQG